MLLDSSRFFQHRFHLLQRRHVSLTRAISSVGSFGLVVIVLMVWWWTDLDTKAKAQHEAYLDTSDNVENLRRSSRELKEKVRALEDEHELLERDANKAATQLEGGDRADQLQASVEALTHRADALRHALIWFSYALVPFDDQRPEAQLDALGGPFDGDRILLTKIAQKGDVLLVSGSATEKADVAAFQKRLAACGYLSDPTVTSTVQRTDATAQRTYVDFEASVELRAEVMPDVLRDLQ